MQKSNRMNHFIGILIVTLIVLITAVIPLVFNEHYYFIDDTQNGAMGQWFELGKSLSHGKFPILNLSAQSAGNYIMEGQWGVVNPLTWLIAIFVYLIPNFLISATIIKVFFLLILGLGTFELTRTLTKDVRLQVLAGAILPTVAFTAYIDASSWVTGLIVFALLPWFWWSFRMFLKYQKVYIFVVFVVGYSLIATGYVYGTIYVVAILVGSFIQNLLEKNWATFLRITIISAILAGVTFAIYLPGILTSAAGITARDSGLSNNDFMSPNVSSLFNSFIPNALGDVTNYWGGNIWRAPVLYISWVLPIVAFLNFERNPFTNIKNSFNGELIAMAVVSFFLTFAPSEMGPIRFPVRNYSYVGFTIIILIIFLLSKGKILFNKKRSIFSGIIIIFGVYLSWSQIPENGLSFLKYGLFIFVLINLLVFVAVNHDERRMLFVALVLIGQIFITAQQHKQLSASTMGDQQSLQTYTAVKKTTSVFGKNPGNVWIAGSMNPNSAWKYTLYSNYWYIGSIKTGAVYTPIGYAKYNTDLKRQWAQGTFAIQSIDRLFTVDKTTQMRIVDLLSIDTIQIIKSGDKQDIKDYNRITKTIPTGWHLYKKKSQYVIWKKNKTTQKIGSIVWRSSNISVREVVNTSRTIKFKIEKLNGQSGKVVFSRLSWPGYEIKNSNARSSIGKPLRGYLLKAIINKNDVGKTITIHFTPPFFEIGIMLIFSDIAIVTVWTIFSFKRKHL
ncbi:MULTISPECIES: hypothetical protein [unclassified Leuconostoc]|uniref:hypothetical protein n=1 Tax=unclassified Leuconostoc TaxID=2685106 RepID=UPI0019031F99|nr:MULTISPECIES: hypothetical protein [unclassified Leuconostoc]MBK0040231.1 hypothetical protein [Leuconostoc sp. S51]MBK0051190.1 hypothetical protein [Leuconostoc sp. S50]